jgi:hypothetical protein
MYQKEVGSLKENIRKGRIADPHGVNADPAFFIIADPDPDPVLNPGF